MNEQKNLVIGCSPRQKGNSDKAAEIVVQTLADMEESCELIFLRDKSIIPCQGCRGCLKTRDNRCVLVDRDDVQEILLAMSSAGKIYFCSPVYFYHVPAVFKALIDRGQSFYEAWMREGAPVKDLRRAFCVLVAGRRKGELLFKGSLISMKYFLQPFGYVLEDLCLRGVDQKNDLASDPESRELIKRFVQRA